MHTFKPLAIALMAGVLLSCSEERSTLQKALRSESPLITEVMDRASEYEVQIMLTEINRKGDSVTFTDHEFRADTSEYFYPASTVKFPVALLALEEIAVSDQINSETPFLVEGDSLPTTLKKEVSKIFAVSDNDAYNRLFEILGKDAINSRLKAKGIGPLRISHRVGTDNSDRLTTRPVTFLLQDSTSVIMGNIENAEIESLSLNKVLKGKGYYANDSLISEPMDFSKKNYLPVQALHQTMKRVMFPENFTSEEQFHLEETDREYLLSSMHTPPYQQGYDREEYYDSYVKFFLFGDSEEPMPEDIRIYNKVGYAYGYLTDCAYIVDETNGIEFLLTATIHVNANGIYNDNTYEYDETGIPFLAELGRAVHEVLTEGL